MIVVRVEALYGRASGQPFNHEGIAEFIGGGDDQFHARHVCDAEVLFERLDIFPKRLLQFVEWDRAQSSCSRFQQ